MQNIAQIYLSSFKKSHKNAFIRYTKSISKFQKNRNERRNERRKIIECIQDIQQRRTDKSPEEQQILLSNFESSLTSHRSDIKKLESLEKSLLFFRRLAEYARLSINEINHTECKVEKVIEDLEDKFKKQKQQQYQQGKQLSEDSIESFSSSLIRPSNSDSIGGGSKTDGINNDKGVIGDDEDYWNQESANLFNDMVVDAVRTKCCEDAMFRLECNPSTNLLDYYNDKDQHVSFYNISESQKRKVIDTNNDCAICRDIYKKRIFVRNRCCVLNNLVSHPKSSPLSPMEIDNEDDREKKKQQVEGTISPCMCDKELYPLCLECMIDGASNRLRNMLFKDFDDCCSNSTLESNEDGKQNALSDINSCIVACPVCRGGICCYDFLIVHDTEEVMMSMLRTSTASTFNGGGQHHNHIQNQQLPQHINSFTEPIAVSYTPITNSIDMAVVQQPLSNVLLPPPIFMDGSSSVTVGPNQQINLPDSILSILPTSGDMDKTKSVPLSMDPSMMINNNNNALDDTELTEKDDYYDPEDEDEDEDDDEVLDELHDNVELIDRLVKRMRDASQSDSNNKNRSNRVLCNVLSALNKRISNLKSTVDDTRTILYNNTLVNNNNNNNNDNNGEETRTKKKRGKKSCSLCGIKGHTRPTCSKNDERTKKIYAKFNIENVKREIKSENRTRESIYDDLSQEDITNSNNTTLTESELKSVYDATIIDPSMLNDITEGIVGGGSIRMRRTDKH
jgi:exonuclease VII small subunit